MILKPIVFSLILLFVRFPFKFVMSRVTIKAPVTPKSHLTTFLLRPHIILAINFVFTIQTSDQNAVQRGRKPAKTCMDAVWSHRLPVEDVYSNHAHVEHVPCIVCFVIAIQVLLDFHSRVRVHHVYRSGHRSRCLLCFLSARRRDGDQLPGRLRCLSQNRHLQYEYICVSWMIYSNRGYMREIYTT